MSADKMPEEDEFGFYLIPEDELEDPDEFEVDLDDDDSDLLLRREDEEVVTYDKGGIPIIDTDDFNASQLKAYDTARRNKIREKSKAVYKVSKDDLDNMSFGVPWAPSSVSVQHKKKEGEKTMQYNQAQPQQQLPQVRGYSGPHWDQQGNAYYVDMQTQQAVGAQQMIAYLQQMQQQNQYPQPQQMPNNMGMQRQQPHYSNYPPPNVNQNQNFGGIQQRNNPGQQPMMSHQEESHSSSDWMLSEDNTQVVQTPQETFAPAPQQWQSTQPQVDVGIIPEGSFMADEDTIEDILGNRNLYSISFDKTRRAIGRFVSSTGETIKLIIDRSREMRKGDFVTLADPDVGIVDDALKDANNVRPPKTEMELAVCDTTYNTSNLQEAILAVNHISKTNDNKPAIMMATICTVISEIDTSDEEAVEAILSLKDNDFMESYYEIRDELTETYPAVVTHIDRKIDAIVNQVLLYVMKAGFGLDTTYLVDMEDVRNELDDQGRLDEFDALMEEHCIWAFNFDVNEMTIGESKPIDVLCDVEMAPIIKISTNEIAGDMTMGVVCSEETPELNEALIRTIKSRKTLGSTNPYTYVTNDAGNLIKVTSTRATVEEMSIHVVVESIY